MVCTSALLVNVTHLFFLANPVRTRHGLKVILWIPVTVEDDYGIGSCQVNTQAAGARRQQEAEVLRVFSVEMIQCLLAHVTSDGSIQTLKQV